jgi:hypothetical protein
MPERVGIPGFLRGRRYRAIDAAAEYFTLYEAEDAAVLTGAHYLERLNNPTPATRTVIPQFFRIWSGAFATCASPRASGRADRS